MLEKLLQLQVAPVFSLTTQDKRQTFNKESFCLWVSTFNTKHTFQHATLLLRVQRVQIFTQTPAILNEVFNILTSKYQNNMVKGQKHTLIHSHKKGTWEIHTRHSENPKRINYLQDLSIDGRI